MHVEEALTTIEMATLLDPGDPQVRTAGERAREILGALRARPFLDRLEAAMARAPAARIDAAGRRTPTATGLSVETLP